MTACMMTYIQKPAEQKDFGQSAREPGSAQHPPPAGAGAEAAAPLLRPHRTAPPRGRGPPAGRGRARGGPGAVLPAGPRGTAAAAAEPESGRGGRHGSGAEPGAVSGAGGRGFLGARRCGGSAPLSEGFVVCLFFFFFMDVSSWLGFCFIGCGVFWCFVFGLVFFFFVVPIAGGAVPLVSMLGAAGAAPLLPPRVTRCPPARTQSGRLSRAFDLDVHRARVGLVPKVLWQEPGIVLPDSARCQSAWMERFLVSEEWLWLEAGRDARVAFPFAETLQLGLGWCRALGQRCASPRWLSGHKERLPHVCSFALLVGRRQQRNRSLCK